MSAVRTRTRNAFGFVTTVNSIGRIDLPADAPFIPGQKVKVVVILRSQPTEEDKEWAFLGAMELASRYEEWDEIYKNQK